MALAGVPAPRPLYGLDTLAQRPDAPVLVLEGEKAADAAGTLFPDHAVTTWPGRCQAVAKADWRPLQGRDVVIWPDHDQPGVRAALAVAKACSGASDVRIVDLPSGTPDRWDVADPLPEGWTTETLAQLVDSAKPGVVGIDRESPRPLRRTVPPAEPYPVDHLGDILGTAARAIHERVQSPMAICAQSVLAAATLAAQGLADVELPGGRRRPLNCYFVDIAETGERKTTTDE